MSDGERVIVLGWDRATETPLWWQRDGLSWQRHTMPATFGALPLDARGRSRRGSWRSGRRHRQAAETPVFWHLGDGVTWEREAIPVHAGAGAADPADVRAKAR